MSEEIEVIWEGPAPHGIQCMRCEFLAKREMEVGRYGGSIGSGDTYYLCDWHEGQIFEIYREDMKADREAAVDRAIKESYYGGRA